MSPLRKNILLFTSVWPVVYIVGFLLFFSAIFNESLVNEFSGVSAPLFVTIFVMHIGTVLMVLWQTIAYMRHLIVENKRVTNHEKLAWMMCLLCLSILCFFPYWFVHIRPESDASLMT